MTYTFGVLPGGVLSGTAVSLGERVGVGTGWRSELSVAAGSGREALGARLALAGIGGGLAERELVGHRGGQGEADALPGRAAIAPHAAGRERGDGPRERLRLLAGPSGRHHAVDE